MEGVHGPCQFRQTITFSVGSIAGAGTSLIALFTDTCTACHEDARVKVYRILHRLVQRMYV